MVYNTLPNRVLISNTFNISELFTFEINQMILQMSIVPKKKNQDVENLNFYNMKYNCSVINHQYSLGLHTVMFIPALERLSTEQQKANWLHLARNYQIIGTYAQTELGHGKAYVIHILTNNMKFSPQTYL